MRPNAKSVNLKWSPSGRSTPNALVVGRRPAAVDLDVAAGNPAQLRQLLHERRHADLRLRMVGGEGHQHAAAPHPLRLLRPRRERPCHRSAAQERDELAPPSITSSARASRLGGTMRTSALAVARLRISSTLVD